MKVVRGGVRQQGRRLLAAIFCVRALGLGSARAQLVLGLLGRG